MVGGFEPVAKPWVAPSEIPYPFEFQLLDEDWEHFSVLMESALERIPALEQTGIRKFYNGPESFTPDNQFLLGEAPGLAGLLRRRRLQLGRHRVGRRRRVARWPSGWSRASRPWTSRRSTSVASRRTPPTTTWLRSRVAEILGLHYAVPWPNREPETARDVRLSPLHQRHGRRGRVPSAPATAGSGRCTSGRRSTTAGASRPGSSTAPPSRSPAATAVAVFDQTSFSKYVVRGPDALAALQWVCAADVDVPVGQAVYTPWLNARGAYESDVTVTRDRRRRVPRRLERRDHRARPRLARRARPRGRRGRGRRRPSDLAVLGVMGPRSRELLPG